MANEFLKFIIPIIPAVLEIGLVVLAIILSCKKNVSDMSVNKKER